MYNLTRLISVLININQETVLNWFGIVDPRLRNLAPNLEDYGIDQTNIPASPDVSLETLRLIVEGLWDKFQSGLGFSDIEDIVLVIAFIRFIVLIIRYNLKTSFYITCIGIVAAYLWYRHLIDLTINYRDAFWTNRLTRRLAKQSATLSAMHRGLRAKAGYKEGLGNPLGVLQFAIYKASTDGPYRIDPISMIFSKLPQSWRSTTDSLYYYIYRDVGPWMYKYCQREATIMAGLVSYVYITRVSKKYCPYLVRWHWTFLMILDFAERPFYSLGQRIGYYLNQVLIPASNDYLFKYDSALLFEIEWVRALLTALILSHTGFVLFGLLHALCGQYFYFPFLTENTEIHIGPRPTDSIYSGGYTAWQDPNEKNKLRVIPKLWYGWLGKGSDSGIPGFGFVNRFFNKLKNLLVKQLRKRFRR